MNVDLSEDAVEGILNKGCNVIIPLNQIDRPLLPLKVLNGYNSWSC
ncbi:hypothetical protein HanRHA438_Chr11g0500071 [Helianthus annuus]|nr:hypothetical protein HanHA300_Chr11g0399301 [Helianthus annuus]KAJ0517212.1 hypothetical protein HanHA89_Chr11g0422781 [Helianthus annuus]KAJ0685221.1 hypothetical protein HanLR1_Chr11g0400211 [Helianthus annuus]KAJ0689129.1 hypothetical protein HanOQP8_Chr11g0402201 [Helianthus annuus]KAJ0870402.1 hypothetical protein HanRHA438_Chr11g0500071 [Helianthus annuus]